MNEINTIKVTSIRANMKDVPEGPVQLLRWETLEMPDGESIILFQINRYALLFSDNSIMFMSENSQFPTLEAAKSSEVWWAKDFKLTHRPLEGVTLEEWEQHVKDRPVPVGVYYN